MHVHCVEVLHVAHTRVCVQLRGGNNAKIRCEFCSYLDSRFENIYDTERSERLNDHSHVHNQFRTVCARARGCVHVFDFCHDWTKYLH